MTFTILSKLRINRPLLIFRGLLDAVDDKGLYRPFSRLQFQAKLLMERREDRRPRRIRRRCFGGRVATVCTLEHRGTLLWRPLQGPIIVTLEACFVYNIPPQFGLPGQYVR